MSTYAPGTPCWVDLASPHVDASVDFYGKLMGWTTTEPSLEAGGYRRFQQGAADIAGVDAPDAARSADDMGNLRVGRRRRSDRRQGRGGRRNDPSTADGPDRPRAGGRV